MEIPEEESMVKKIRNKVIKGISASLDPEYEDKETGKKMGWTLWHAAIVAEPYLKGMEQFQELSEEFKNKQVIKLENMTKKKKEEVSEEETESKESEEEEDKKSKSSKGEQEEEKEEKEDKKEILKSKLGKLIKESKEQTEKYQEALTELDDVDLNARKLRELELKENKHKFDDLVRDGKALPSQEDEVLAILSAQSNKVNLSDKEVSVVDAFTSFLEKSKKVSLGEEKGKVEEGEENEEELTPEEEQHLKDNPDVNREDFIKYAKNEEGAIDPSQLPTEEKK